ncbi:MAG TPA: esterase-like activity of phytase family protein [Acidobacteriota bacterium]|nr:esterase-like activity of phytase family protein [Acidobacteriota bacterium]
MANVLVLILVLLGLFSWAYPQTTVSDPATRIIIHSTPIPAFQPDTPSRSHFGSLEFCGGLVLSSAHKSFGGISALVVHSDGAHFLALSDCASWIRGRIVYDNNRPSGIADASAAPVLDEYGKPAPQWDTESIAEDGNTLYVGIERINRIFSFDFDWRSFPRHARPVSAPPELKELPFNKGLEAMVFIPKNHRLAGTLIAFSEEGLTAEGNLKSFLIGGRTPGLFSVKRSDGYDISDAALLPDGDILILERQYSLQRGVQMRIRRIHLDEINPGALVDGPAVIEADMRCQIDNMEAMSVHQNRAGEAVITLMSDDNFSPMQRTLLLQFVFKGK